VTSRAGSRLLYLVRDTSGDTRIDTYDVDTQQIVFDISAFPAPGTPIGITDGPDDHLYVLGQGGTSATGFTEIDPADGSVVLTHSFMVFAGDNVALTNLEVETVVAVDEAGRPSRRPFAHLAVPNPFNARVEIRFELAMTAAVRVAVHDLHGRLVRDLRGGVMPAGWHGVPWDGRDDKGMPLPSGAYLYRLRIGEDVAVGKLELVK
jgi:hypothetical protein